MPVSSTADGGGPSGGPSSPASPDGDTPRTRVLTLKEKLWIFLEDNTPFNLFILVVIKQIETTVQ